MLKKNAIRLSGDGTLYYRNTEGKPQGSTTVHGRGATFIRRNGQVEIEHPQVPGPDNTLVVPEDTIVDGMSYEAPEIDGRKLSELLEENIFYKFHAQGVGRTYFLAIP